MNLKQLYRLIVRSVYQSLNMQQREPQIIANLVWNLPRNINKSVRGVRVGGVFVHASPLVGSPQFPQSGAVEIGDRLLLRRERRKGQIFKKQAS